jgi:hypothetical protein
MARTSRCFVQLLSQFGRFHALVTVQRYRCDLHLADFSFAPFTRCPPAIFFSTGRAEKMEHPYEVIVGDRFSNQRARVEGAVFRPRTDISTIFASEPQAHRLGDEVVAHRAAV